MKIAIGIVIAIVNSPQGDSARAFTTTIERIAMIISIIPNIAIIVTPPTNVPNSSFIISPSDLPFLLEEINKTTKS